MKYKEAQHRTLWQDFFGEQDISKDILLECENTDKHTPINIDFWDIEEFNDKFADDLLAYPTKILSIGEELINSLAPPETTTAFHLRIKKIPKTNRLNIRDIRDEHLNNFLSIEGLIKRVSEVKPTTIVSYHECLRCHSIMRVYQTDSKFREPLECSKEDPTAYVDKPGCGSSGNRTSFMELTEMAENIDLQEIDIQEPPEELKAGEEPRNIIVRLYHDMVGKLLPGNRIIFNGVLNGLRVGTGAKKSKDLYLYIEGNSIEYIDEVYEDIELSEDEIKHIKELSTEPDIYDKLTRSIAPSIIGMAREKESLLLQLLGGTRKTVDGGIKIRGDIHVLLVGDTGTSKSQLLTYISKLAPRGSFTSGKTTTSAGLTATAKKVNSPLGQGKWYLEAGALVLADKGHCCIDEFDKMSKEDRGSIHFGMEQQFIPVSKAV